MDLQKQYQELAAQLGDICYKLQLLEQHKQKLISDIKKLDELAGMMAKKDSNEAQQTQAEGLSNRTNSPD